MYVGHLRDDVSLDVLPTVQRGFVREQQFIIPETDLVSYNFDPAQPSIVFGPETTLHRSGNKYRPAAHWSLGNSVGTWVPKDNRNDVDAMGRFRCADCDE